MEIPVYLFTGFLDSGKTGLLNETLSDPKFFSSGNERTLVLLFEEGEVEPDEKIFVSKDIFIEKIENERQLNPDKLEALRRKHSANRVIIEYNGMWQISELFSALPEGWIVYQEMCLADAETFEIFNANMRNLVVDKISSCEMIIFNRCDDDTDYDSLHKIVRAISRMTDIVYERKDGSYKLDDTEDPLPFDVNAPTVNIEDRDFALFYRDLSDSMPDYNGKTVCFKGCVIKNNRIPAEGFVIGREVMTCCVDDISFSGLYCENGADKIKDGEWIILTAEINVKNSKVYGRKGPVLKLISAQKTDAPAEKVASFY